MNVSQQIDVRIKELTGWRGEYLSTLRSVLHEAYPSIVEDWKWNSSIFNHNGLVCSIGSFKDHVKLHFFKGAELEDKDKVFNTGFEAKTTRGINFFENDKIDKAAIINVVKKAVAYNDSLK